LRPTNESTAEVNKDDRSNGKESGKKEKLGEEKKIKVQKRVDP
jgi:hypothetical protein